MIGDDAPVTTGPAAIARALVAAVLSVIVGVRPALAHGFGQRYDLPVPLGLWISGAAVAVAFSFVVIARFANADPGAHRARRLDLLRFDLGRALADRRTRTLAQALAVVSLGLIVATGLAGNQNPTRNLAPTAIWIVWWVGFAYVSALVGDLWAAINPWAALFTWVDAVVQRLGGGRLAVDVPYPQWLGHWPAIVLFTAFAWIELVWGGRAIPAQLALMVVIYSLITWGGMLLFGRDVWLGHGDPFAVAFGVLSRFAPTEARVTSRGVSEWTLRPFGAGLYEPRDVSPSMVVFVLLLLSTVTFDGFTATTAWVALESALYDALWPLGDLRLAAINTLGLLAFPVVFVGVYLVFADWMAALGERRLSTERVARLFVLSLVPIAIAYHLAHYFTFLLIQGQLMIRLVSDPFGFGWDLFGTAGFRPDIAIVGARFAWYTAVTAIVLGHIVAVWVAHVVAVREFATPRVALRSQLPMLVLMVGYTMVSLWIIAQPIVETGSRG